MFSVHFFSSDDSKTQEKKEIEGNILFFTISSKMKSMHRSSIEIGFVRIYHYSSKTEQWVLSEFNADGYQEALAEVQRIEAGFFSVPKIVAETPNDQLSRLRFVVRPCAKDTKNGALYVELNNTIKQLQLQLIEVKETKSGITDQIKGLESLLLRLQNLTIEKCSWEIIAKVNKQIRRLRK